MKKLILLLSLFISMVSFSQENYNQYSNKPSNSPSEVKQTQSKTKTKVVDAPVDKPEQYQSNPADEQPKQRVLDENYHYTEQYPYPHYHRGRRHRECDGHYDGWARQEWRYFVGGVVAVATAVTGWFLYESLVDAAH